MILKIVYKTILICMALSLLTACATKYKDLEWSHYNDVTDGLFVTKDQSKLLLIGKKYHYIFDLNDSEQKLLDPKLRKYLTLHITSCIVDANTNEVYLEYTLISKGKDQDIWLKSGFHKVNGAVKEAYIFRKWGLIEGIRYLANNNMPAHYKLSKSYEFSVSEKHYSSTRTVISTTPVKYVTGMTLGLGMVAVWYPFYLIGDNESGPE